MTNILEVLGVESKEDVVSNLLRFAIAESSAFRRAFVVAAGAELREWSAHTVRTRASVTGAGIPDIVVGLESKEGSQLLMIENKLRAEEGDDQTERYAADSVIASLASTLGLRHPPVTTLVFLTLFPDEVPASPRFSTMTYEKILNHVATYERGENALVDELTSALFDVLSRFYAAGSVGVSDHLMERLSGRSALEGEYLYFRSFIRRIELPGGLEHGRFFRQSNPGRRYYGAQISKPSWKPDKMPLDPKTWELVGAFEPRRHFSVHFELQHNVLNGILRIYLHYEINPYNTEKWATTNLPPDKYAEYSAVRAQFERSLAAAAIRGLTVGGGGSNQVARADISLQGKTTGEALDLIADLLRRVAPVVDDLVSSVTGIKS